MDLFGVDTFAVAERKVGPSKVVGGREMKVEFENGKVAHPGFMAGRGALVRAGHPLKV